MKLLHWETFPLEAGGKISTAAFSVAGFTFPAVNALERLKPDGFKQKADSMELCLFVSA